MTHNEKKQLSAAYRYSYTRFALNFYGFFEMTAEMEEVPEEFDGYRKEMLELLSSFLGGDLKPAQLEELRNSVTGGMERLVEYAECFQIYEYVFNRLERRFSTVRIASPSQEEVIAQLMNFFTGSKDSMVMNGRIQSVIEEVPIRFTKAKFFGIIKESLSAYSGSPKKDLEDFLARLNIFAKFQMSAEEMPAEKYSSDLKALSLLDFKTLSREDYIDSGKRLSNAGEFMSMDIEAYSLLQELVNDLLVLSLSRESVMIEMGEEALVSGIVGDILDLFMTGNKEIPDEIFERMELLEGKQETYYEKYASLSIENPGDEAVRKIERLLSNSPFLSLCDDTADTQAEIADAAWVETRLDAFCDELSQVFAGQPKPMVRAIMAKIISHLPVWFRSLDEIKEYIKSGLEACVDMDEKECSIELMRKIMEMEYALV